MELKHVFIQGAGRGLGLAICKRLLENANIQIHASARHPEAAVDLQALARRYASPRLIVLPLDITRRKSIGDARETVGQHTARLDLLLICAGLLHDDGMWPEKKLADVDADHLARSFAVNASGPLLMIKHFHDLLIHGRRAVIASLSARVGSIGDNRLGGWYAYRASKAAQNQFTRTAAIELRRKSRQLICVGLHPGTVDTALSAPFQARVPEGQLHSADQAAAHLLDVIANLTPEDSGCVFDWAGERIEP